MTPFRRILVPTDFSKHSEEAVRVAAGLSRLCAAPLTVMTVYETLVVPVPEDGVLPTPKVMVGAYEHTCQQLAHVAEQARAEGAVAVESVVLQGAPFIEIMARAHDGDYDLIVMGTHGRTGLKHLVLGSVAEHVVRRAPCAVLTIRLRASAPGVMPHTA